MIRWAGVLVATLFAPAAADATWHRAESDHFIVYAELPQDDLTGYVSRLEQFDDLLRQFSGVADELPPVKLRIYMVEDYREVQSYIGDEDDAVGFYSPDVNGPFAVVPQEDFGRGQYSLTADVVLFHEYAHHFMLQYFPASYPAWYVEGFAEFYSTVSFREDGRAVVGLPPPHRATSFRYGTWIRAQDLLSNERENTHMTYAQGWLVTHYVSTNSEVRDTFARYLNAIRDGATGEDAYDASFGQVRPPLDRVLRLYLQRNRFPALAVDLDPIAPESIDVEPITDEQAIVALLHPRRPGDLFERINYAVRYFPTNAQAQVELARYHHARDDLEAALAASDRALALDPGNVGATLTKGRILIDAAEASHDTADPRWEEGRNLIIRANNAEPDNALALMAYYQSFPTDDERPEIADQALERAFLLVPQSPEPRLLLAETYLDDGRFQEALNLVLPLVQTPHESEARTAGENIASRARARLDPGTDERTDG